MKKAILFARVSTSQQDNNRQINELKPLAKSDGYKESEIAQIKYTESAIKNSVQNRKSISELKELIETQSIEAVYVTEISRLARRDDVMYSVLSILEEKKIALVIKSPSLIRTYENGIKNSMAHVIISFLAQVAVQEMELKKERQTTGYKQKVSMGRVCSSQVKFGYDRDRDKMAIVDNEKAKMVNDIFHKYLDGQSVASIWDYYKHLGIFRSMTDQSGWCRIGKILRDKTYIGKNEHFKYPPIVSDELFNKVQSKLDDSQLIKTRLTYVYYCQGILKYENYSMTPNSAKAMYRWFDANNKKTYGINANVIDTFAFNLACEALSSSNATIVHQRKENATESLKMAKSRILGIGKELDERQESIDRLNYIYVQRKIKQSVYDERMETLEGEVRHLEKELNEQNILVTELELTLKKTDKEWMQGMADYNNLLNVTDDHERQRMVREAIERIEVVKNGRDYDMKIAYHDKSLNDSSLYKYIQRGRKVRIVEFYDAVFTDLSQDWGNRIVPSSKRRKGESQ